MPIRVLSQEVASAIAAGEVVERPASVVKELIENALDAGARRIAVRIEGGGRQEIDVVDDGCGIPAEEAPLALERYSTSKLERADDLFAIQTLGFRGEALASIAAVSRMTLVTRGVDEATGIRLCVEGGKLLESLSIGAPAGTQVRVRDLFYNVPARLKFLKTENTERRRIATLVTRYALAYPSVALSLESGGRTIFRSSGSGDRREAAAEVYGPEIGRAMIPLSPAEGQISIHGLVSPPSVTRSNRRELAFFVNGRWVQDSSLSAAVLQAYHTLLMVGRYPIVFLDIRMPPESVDVNVHPAKAEVRFREPDVLFRTVQRAARATLLGHAPVPGFESVGGWGAAQRELGAQSGRPLLWSLGHESAISQGSVELQPALPVGGVPLLRAIGQVGGLYLVAEGPDGLYLIDQHAAHERVLFEQFMQAVDARRVEAQGLIEAKTVELDPPQAELLEEQLEVVRSLGFDVEPFGGRSYRLRAIPAVLGPVDPVQALLSVVEEIEEDEAPLAAEREARIVARVCKRAAVKAGQVLSLAEQQRLLRDLEGCQSPRTCPHGRPTMIHLSVDTLERQFGRRG